MKQITQQMIDNDSEDAVLVNNAMGTDGMAMKLEIDDSTVYFDIADGQEQDDMSIYTLDNILYVD